MLQDRIAFGQSVSVNAVQMAAAVNTIANGGVRVSPEPDPGHGHHQRRPGRRHRPRHHATGWSAQNAAHQMTQMMERVVDPDVGVAPRRAGARATGSPARPAPRSGSARRAAATTASSRSPSPASRPADDPRFTVYVVVQNPRNGGGGGSVGGPGVQQDHVRSRCAGTAYRRPARQPSHIPHRRGDRPRGRSPVASAPWRATRRPTLRPIAAAPCATPLADLADLARG